MAQQFDRQDFVGIRNLSLLTERSNHGHTICGRHELCGIQDIALGPKRQSGRPSKLPASQYEAFKTRFLVEPTAADGVCTLRAKEAQQILAQEFGVEYTLGGIYDLLHRLGLSCLVPRPGHPKNDPVQMQQWRDEAPLLSRRRRGNIRTDGSNCGSKMKPASDSKGP